MPQPIDPDAAARPDAGIFGLDCARAESAIILLPVPFDATVSYGGRPALGPSAILRASHQVELFDVQTGRPYAQGIHMLDEDPAVRRVCEEARQWTRPIIEKGGAQPGDEEAVRRVDELCRGVHDGVRDTVAGILKEGRLPGLVGGDHSVALGCIAAAAAVRPGLGVLQIDAHADLRPAFEGFTHSHASIMDNVLREVEAVSRIVQVGVRDISETEMRLAQEEPRIVMFHDVGWRGRLARGETLMSLCEEVIAALPEFVYVSFDIDGLDPALCPHTGTPVPGGLSFHDCTLLLQMLVESGRRIVAFDLTEVSPGPNGDEWDGNVGARVLYKLCGFALLAALTSPG